mgnify:CR=1 FL=1
MQVLLLPALSVVGVRLASCGFLHWLLSRVGFHPLGHQRREIDWVLKHKHNAIVVGENDLDPLFAGYIFDVVHGLFAKLAGQRQAVFGDGRLRLSLSSIET